MVRRPPRPTLFPHTPPYRSLAAVHDSHPPAARSGHPRLREPFTLRGIQLVHHVDSRGALLIIRELAADQVDFSIDRGRHRSEEHTSELQSRQYLVCRLLLEK